MICRFYSIFMIQEIIVLCSEMKLQRDIKLLQLAFNSNFALNIDQTPNTKKVKSTFLAFFSAPYLLGLANFHVVNHHLLVPLSNDCCQICSSILRESFVHFVVVFLSLPLWFGSCLKVGSGTYVLYRNIYFKSIHNIES